MKANASKSARQRPAAQAPANGAGGDKSDRYRIRDKANVPKRIFLYDPATKEKTEDWLDVYSSLSDNFRAARDEAMQGAVELAAIADPEERKEKMADAMNVMFASLIADWSFDLPCTTENKAGFLRDAPQVKNMLQSTADSSEAFFGNA